MSDSVKRWMPTGLDSAPMMAEALEHEQDEAFVSGDDYAKLEAERDALIEAVQEALGTIKAVKDMEPSLSRYLPGLDWLPKRWKALLDEIKPPLKSYFAKAVAQLLGEPR